MNNERLVRIATKLLEEGCTKGETIRMLKVLVTRRNTVDNVVEIVREARVKLYAGSLIENAMLEQIWSKDLDFILWCELRSFDPHVTPLETSEIYKDWVFGVGGTREV